MAFLFPTRTEKEDTNGENIAKANNGMVVIKPASTLFIDKLCLMNFTIGPTEVIVVLRLHAIKIILIISNARPEDSFLLDEFITSIKVAKVPNIKVKWNSSSVKKV